MLPADTSPDTPMNAYQTLKGKVHLRQRYPWGYGPACSDRFTRGTAIAARVADIDCLHCNPHHPRQEE